MSLSGRIGQAGQRIFVKQFSLQKYEGNFSTIHKILVQNINKVE